MASYRTKSEIIEAWQNVIDGGRMPDWVMDIVERTESGSLIIHTHEGTMRAEINDWIIGRAGNIINIYKPDAFAATYESVDDSHVVTQVRGE